MAIRCLNKIIGLSFAVLLATTTHAEASTTKLGDVLNNFNSSIGGMPGLLSGVAYLMGLFFAIVGIFKFKDHVDNPSHTPLSAGVKRFLAGGMLFSSPFMGSALKGNLVGTGATNINFSSATGSTGGVGGMDQMIVDFVNNIAQPASYLLIAFAYISAIILLVTGIVRLTHTAQEGPRGPAGLGTIMTFLSSGALFSFGEMIGTFSNSLFGSATVTTYPTIGSSVMSSADAAPVEAIIQSLMVFIAIVGFIAFMRGWFVLKAFADGNSQASVAQALTFLIGGTMAINLGAFINVLENTVGLGGGTTGITFG